MRSPPASELIIDKWSVLVASSAELRINLPPNFQVYANKNQPLRPFSQSIFQI